MEATLRQKIRALDGANKQVLLIRAAFRDTVTAGDILQTAIDYLPNHRPPLPDSPQTLEERILVLIQRALDSLNDEWRDELLYFAGLRNPITCREIMQAPVAVRAEEGEVSDEDGQRRCK